MALFAGTLNMRTRIARRTTTKRYPSSETVHRILRAEEFRAVGGSLTTSLQTLQTLQTLQAFTKAPEPDSGGGSACYHPIQSGGRLTLPRLDALPSDPSQCRAFLNQAKRIFRVFGVFRVLRMFRVFRVLRGRGVAYRESCKRCCSKS